MSELATGIVIPLQEHDKKTITNLRYPATLEKRIHFIA